MLAEIIYHTPADTSTKKSRRNEGNMKPLPACPQGCDIKKLPPRRKLQAKHIISAVSRRN